MESGAVLLREILSSVKGIVFKARRDAKIVAGDYDQGNWSRVLQEKRWLKLQNLSEYVLPEDDSKIVAKIDNRLVRIGKREYYQYRLRRLQEVLLKYAGDSDALVELGSGYGMNVFSLVLADRWKSIHGYDISPNGIQAAREAAAHFKLNHVQFDMIDLTDSSHPSFKQLAGKTCFTYLCLEQLKYATGKILQGLLEAKVARCVHIEPSFELLRLWAPSDLVNYLYVKKNDYQDNLLYSLRKLEREGRVRITGAERLYYAPTHRNDPTLICWEPVK